MEVLLALEHERQPEEKAVVGDVQRDPDERGRRRAPAQGRRDELADRRFRFRRRAHGAGLHRPPGDLLQHLGRLSAPSAPSQEVRALRQRPPDDEREEGRERGRQEQVAPAPVAEPVEVRTEEEEREPGRQKQPDGPPEIEEDEQSSAPLRREILGQHRRVDDEQSSEPEPRQEAEGHHRPRPPRERGASGEDRVPEDRVLEDRPAPDPVGETAEDEAAEQRARERRAVDQARPGAAQVPLRRKDGLDEADEQDLHRHEGPGRPGDEDRLLVETRDPALAEDLLDVRARDCEVGCRHLQLGLRL